jgi:hypothetical protein
MSGGDSMVRKELVEEYIWLLQPSQKWFHPDGTPTAMRKRATTIWYILTDKERVFIDAWVADRISDMEADCYGTGNQP